MRRRPFRFCVVLIGFAVIVVGLAALAAEIWFRRELAAARREVALGHNAAAIRHLVPCLNWKPRHPEALLLAARTARRSGELDEADRFLSHYWEAHGESDQYVLERLLLRTSRGELETTMGAIRARLAGGGPDADAAREALIVGLIYRFLWRHAEQALEEWIAEAPDHASAWLLKGKLEEQRQLYEQAIASFQRVVDLDPEHDEARLRLTTLLIQFFRLDNIMTHLDRLRQSLPDNPEVHYQASVALGLLGRKAESREALERCLALNSNYPSALSARGMLAGEEGDEKTALEFLERAARLDPGNMVIRRQYAQALRRNGRLLDAQAEEEAVDRLKADLDHLNQLISGPLQNRSNDPGIHHEIALIAMRTGQAAEALRWLQSALQVDPDHLPTHKTLAEYYYALGKPVLAARHRAMAEKLSAKP